MFINIDKKPLGFESQLHYLSPDTCGAFSYAYAMTLLGKPTYLNESKEMVRVKSIDDDIRTIFRKHWGTDEKYMISAIKKYSVFNRNILGF